MFLTRNYFVRMECVPEPRAQSVLGADGAAEAETEKEGLEETGLFCRLHPQRPEPAAPPGRRVAAPTPARSPTTYT